jgi:hypothetical protein
MVVVLLHGARWKQAVWCAIMDAPTVVFRFNGVAPQGECDQMRLRGL